MSNENLNAPTEEENTKPLVIDINRNIGTSTDEKAVVMPEKVKVDDPTVEAEIEDPNIESENKLLNTETTIANNVANEIEQETTDNSFKKISEQEEIKLPGEEQEIVFPDDAFGTKQRTSINITKDMEAAIELYSTFSQEIGPYVTLEQVKKIIANNYNSDVIGSVVQEIETSKAKDDLSFEEDGRDSKLVNKSLNEIRTVLKDKERPDLAQKVNVYNVKEDRKSVV